jgi:hypothetical protein
MMMTATTIAMMMMVPVGKPDELSDEAAAVFGDCVDLGLRDSSYATAADVALPLPPNCGDERKEKNYNEYTIK